MSADPAEALRLAQRAYRAAYDAHQSEPAGSGWTGTLAAWQAASRELDAAETAAGVRQPAPPPTVCQETAYGSTTRLSFQIKVF